VVCPALAQHHPTNASQSSHQEYSCNGQCACMWPEACKAAPYQQPPSTRSSRCPAATHRSGRLKCRSPRARPGDRSRSPSRAPHGLPPALPPAATLPQAQEEQRAAQSTQREGMRDADCGCCDCLHLSISRMHVVSHVEGYNMHSADAEIQQHPQRLPLHTPRHAVPDANTA
jgi:hypothetical protein